MSVSMLSEYLIHSAGKVLVKIFQGCYLIKGFGCHLVGLGQASRVFSPFLHYLTGSGENTAFF